MILQESRVAPPDLGPDTYARWRSSKIGAITERLERQLILELAGDVGNRSVLDIGCGDGELAVDLAGRGAIVTGIDASAAMIDAARETAGRKGADVDFRIARADDLPFPDATFDAVTAITILCFVEDAGPVFDEMARVLRPGGCVVIGELNRWSSWAAARRVRAWLGSALWRRSRFRTAKELGDLAAMAGLVVTEVRGAVFFPRCAVAARLMTPVDAALGRTTTFGAAFVALAATKPGPKTGH